MNIGIIAKCLVGILVTGLLTCSQANYAQSHHREAVNSPEAAISRISVLSIHISDSSVHDSVFHFLTDKLGLPVEYLPVKYAGRWYAGVYAGNMFLEPCGPFKNFRYAPTSFRAIFFGLNCESDKSIPSLAEDLASRNIIINQGETIQIVDTGFIRQNIYLNIAQKNGYDLTHEDSLRQVLLARNDRHPGIEAIKEIRVGYPDEIALSKWKKIIEPSVLSPEGVWKANEDQSVRFVRSSICEVVGIVFKVRSLEKAKAWLAKNHLSGGICNGGLELDKSKTFGLLIVLSE